MKQLWTASPVDAPQLGKSQCCKQPQIKKMDSAPHLVLFARGVIALLHTWPALRLAVQESWGGPQSAEKRTWLASNLVDAFENEPLDEEQVEHLLLDAMVDEFEAEIDDGSSYHVAQNIVRIWKAACDADAEEIGKLEAAADQLGKKQISTQQQVGNGDDEWSDEESASDDGESSHDAPQAIPPSPSSERTQPVIDEDGFQLVQKGGKRRGHQW